MRKNPVNVLIVDDNPANLLALEAVLGAELECNLVRAHSGDEAIQKVKTENFAAILLDVQMPGLDGYETARRIKRLPRGRDVPIMFITAVYKEDDDMRRGYESGAMDYFAKPLNPDLVRAKVRLYLDLYRLTREKREHDELIAALQGRLAAEKALDKVLQGVSEGVIITDAAGAITRTNHEAKWIWGGATERAPRGREDFVGWWVDSGKSVAPEEWALSKALATRSVHMNEPIAIRCFDGRNRIILESASPLMDEGGAAIGAVTVIKVIDPENLREVPRRRPPAHGGDELGASAPH